MRRLEDEDQSYKSEPARHIARNKDHQLNCGTNHLSHALENKKVLFNKMHLNIRTNEPRTNLMMVNYTETFLFSLQHQKRFKIILNVNISVRLQKHCRDRSSLTQTSEFIYKGRKE